VNPPDNRLRLFVVGEKSGDVSEWPVLGSRAYVVAHTPEEAVSLADSYGPNVAELDLSACEPQVLFVEEDYGSDY
jgi:hypothetical protein